MTPASLARVAFPIPLRKEFDYQIPERLRGRLENGHRVLAPFGPRPSIGIVTGFPETTDVPEGRLKSLQMALDPAPALDAADFDLAQWISRRYFCSLGEALFTVCPVGKKRPPKRPSVKDAAPAPAGAHGEFEPTPEQKHAASVLEEALESGAHRGFLLWGVAAAGKTEVYRRAIAAALSLGRSAFYLVPEIGLTPQIENTLRASFGGALEVWHSEIAEGERWRIWRRALAGDCRVVLGPRSALFLPLKDPGLIVVDEEHDPSYKQDNAPHYHARDVAREKARLKNAVLVLGSATPSMETYRRARAGEFTLLTMSRRVDDRPFPAIDVVDMRRAGGHYLSDTLTDGIKERLDRREQSLLFLNRRGFATFVSCACGWEARCPQCAVTLVYHKDPNEGAAEGLRCHYCFYRQTLPPACPACGQNLVKWSGRGTQRVVADLRLLFPSARILRWDKDAMSKRHAHENAFRAVTANDVDIIVGTQMITQGHDFPRLTLVGILDADRALRFPDFRAAERTFQQITQVAGRAGRADLPGRVVLQTRHPDHYAVQAVLGRDYAAFAEAELAFRQEMGYPPFVEMTTILVRSRNAASAEKAAETLVLYLEQKGPRWNVLGPAPAFHKQRRGFVQWQVVLKIDPALHDEAGQALIDFPRPADVQLSANVDPEDAG